MCAFPKRSKLYCGLFNDCLLTVSFSLFLCFLVRVRCRCKTFTFAISSADEFLVSFYNSTVLCIVKFTGHLLSDEILLREWEREEMGITNGNGKGMGINRG